MSWYRSMFWRSSYCRRKGILCGSSSYCSWVKLYSCSYATFWMWRWWGGSLSIMISISWKRLRCYSCKLWWKFFPLATPQSLNDAFVQDYLEYLRTWVKPRGLYDQYVTEFTRISDEGSWNFYLPTQPLINIWNSESSELMSMSVDLDTSALARWNFQDVIQVQNKEFEHFQIFLWIG